MHKWNEIRLSDVRAINTRLAYAKRTNWKTDIASWTSEKLKEQSRYEQMMSDLERDWDFYVDIDIQQFYDAANLCYHLLDGYTVGTDRDSEILRLTKSVYKIEEKNAKN